MSFNQPLAERLRPTSIAYYIGQSHLVGEGQVLHRAITTGYLPSMILWGPPGVGKTTLANLLATAHKRPFYNLSAISSGVKDIREIIDKAEKAKFFNNITPVLFIDEIHRFSKSQQDSLLGAVEKGTVVLIGATTENPSFEVISALLSRCQVFVLKELTEEELLFLANYALENDEVIKASNISFSETDALIQLSGGDARKLLNIIEILAETYASEAPTAISNEMLTNTIQQNIARYDKGGEGHYDTISAFIKSIRGSDPNAAVYYLARMLQGGEDVKFIARRMIILASEDIGLANPNALLLATTTQQAVHTVGMPEARIILSQCAIYLATSPKSNSAYMAINMAMDAAAKTSNASIPLHLRNAPTKLMKDLDYGKNYAYAHNYENNFVVQEFLPEGLENTSFYVPGENAQENTVNERLKKLWGEKYNNR